MVSVVRLKLEEEIIESDRKGACFLFIYLFIYLSKRFVLLLELWRYVVVGSSPRIWCKVVSNKKVYVEVQN